VRSHLFVAILLAMGVACLGCDKGDGIVAYSAPKEPAKPPASSVNDGLPTLPAAQLPAQPQAQADAIDWTVPAGWKRLPGNEMRYASFQIWPDHPDVLLSVIPLGGGEDLLANVNRWEGQVGLPASKETELPKEVQRVTVDNTTVDIIDLLAPETANPRLRMFAAIVPRPDRTWFFKLQGTADLIGPQKDNFNTFIRSLKFAPTPPGEPASAGGTPVAADTSASPSATPDAPPGATWNFPQGWTQEPQKPMRLASFTAGQAEIIITQFGKDNAGGLLPNINRWRGQVGLEGVNDPKDSPSEAIQVGGQDGALFDFTGPAQNGAAKRIRVAMIISGQTLWFFKLTGPADAVSQQQPSFDAFLKSVQFTGKQ
jgi:hypothetical protein